MAKDSWRTKKPGSKKKAAKKVPTKKKIVKKAPAKKKVAKKLPAKKKVAKKLPAKKKVAKKAPAKKKALTHAEWKDSYIASSSAHEKMLRKAIQSIKDNWHNDPDVKLLRVIHGDEPRIFEDSKMKKLRRYLNFKRIYLSIQINALKAVLDNAESENDMLEELDFSEAMRPYATYSIKCDKVVDRFLAPIDSWFNKNTPG